MKASEVKRGNVVEHEGKVYQVRDIERSSAQGRSGNVTFRFIMYSVPGGVKADLSLRSEDEIKETEVTRRAVSFSYKDGDAFVFMDSEDYEQHPLPESLVGSAANFLLESMPVQIAFHEGAPLYLELPVSVELVVASTEPGLQGDRSSAGTKPATLETGAEIQVPLFINTGDKLKVDSRDGSYLGRVNA